MQEEEEDGSDGDLPPLVSLVCTACSSQLTSPAALRIDEEGHKSYYCGTCYFGCRDEGLSPPRHAALGAPASPDYRCEEDDIDIGGQQPVQDSPVASEAKRVELRLQQRRERARELRQMHRDAAAKHLPHITSYAASMPLRGAAMRAMLAMGTIPPATAQQQQQLLDMEMGEAGDDEQEF